MICILENSCSGNLMKDCNLENSMRNSQEVAQYYKVRGNLSEI